MPLTDTQRAALRFDADGLIPAVVQQHDTGEVLMVAWMDDPRRWTAR
jgi:phosphoribosyl-AMP cyclohydrolase